MRFFLPLLTATAYGQLVDEPTPGCEVVRCLPFFRCVETTDGPICVETCDAIPCPVGVPCEESDEGAFCSPLPACATIRCLPGYECVEYKDGPVCEPLPCNIYPEICPEGTECVKPSLTCEPIEEEKCETTCGLEVDVGVTFTDDGPNICNTCTCGEGGVKKCTEDDCQWFSQCPDTTCETECGLEVESGVRFKDDGFNYCNTCYCNEGNKECTEAACIVEDEDNLCN